MGLRFFKGLGFRGTPANNWGLGFWGSGVGVLSLGTLGFKVGVLGSDGVWGFGVRFRA